LSVVAAAQEPVKPPAPATDTPAPSEPLRRAFVDASVDRMTLHQAASQILKGDNETRARFMTQLHAIAAAATKSEPPPSDPKVEFPEPVRSLMVEAAIGDPAACTAALAQLAERTDGGPAAIARLHDRGRAILQRCLLSHLRTKMATNAIYAGQYGELRVFQPEAGELLLGWAREAPKDVATPALFQAACLRAVRDILPADQATDPLRRDLRAIAQQAERANDESLFLTAACALHQFGDPSLFDQIKTSVAEQLRTEDTAQKIAATNTLADLHYQLREYDVAAAHFQAVVQLLEQAGRGTDTIATVSYNTACSLALAGKIDDAFVYLEKALQAGARSRQLSKALLDEDHDTISLKADPRFAKLMEQHFGPQDKSAK
jgi:tetratricopeptide (TPR) repeat protein